MTGFPAPTLWLANPLRPDRPSVSVQAVGDPGLVAGLVLPASLAFALRLVQRCRRAAVACDAAGGTLPYTGPVELRLGDRCAYFGALIDGHQVRLGLLALEELDLLLDPHTGALRLDAGGGLALAGAPDPDALSVWSAPADGP